MLIFLNIFLVYVLTMHKFFIVLPSFCFLIISQSYGKICDNYFFVAQFDETWNIYHNKSFSFFLLLSFPYQFFKLIYFQLFYAFSQIIICWLNFSLNSSILFYYFYLVTFFQTFLILVLTICVYLFSLTVISWQKYRCQKWLNWRKNY